MGQRDHGSAQPRISFRRWRRPSPAAASIWSTCRSTIPRTPASWPTSCAIAGQPWNAPDASIALRRHRSPRRSIMLEVVQAFDRAPIAEIETDGATGLERKLQAADAVFRDRDGWLKPHQRIAILRRLATLMEGRFDHLAMQIAREGGKPLPDAIVETRRAIDGVHNAADELRNFSGREVPMGLSAAADNRWAFTTREPIGVGAAISAFNHPLNLIVHQVAPAIAVGCPVIIKPASTTPLSCLDFVALVHE